MASSLQGINWLAVGGYLLLGLVGYSPFAFRMELRTSARRLRRLWLAYVAQHPTISAPEPMPSTAATVDTAAAGEDPSSNGQAAMFRIKDMADRALDDLTGRFSSTAEERTPSPSPPPTAEALVETFVQDANKFDQGTYVSDILTLKRQGREIETSVNQPGLVRALACWTFMWPFYGAALVMTDLLGEFFETVADHVIVWANDKVRKTFRDVFSTT